MLLFYLIRFPSGMSLGHLYKKGKDVTIHAINYVKLDLRFTFKYWMISSAVCQCPTPVYLGACINCLD